MDGRNTSPGIQDEKILSGQAIGEMRRNRQDYVILRAKPREQDPSGLLVEANKLLPFVSLIADRSGKLCHAHHNRLRHHLRNRRSVVKSADEKTVDQVCLLILIGKKEARKTISQASVLIFFRIERRTFSAFSASVCTWIYSENSSIVSASRGICSFIREWPLRLAQAS